MIGSAPDELSSDSEQDTPCVGAWLRSHREARGLSLRGMERETGISYGYLGRIEAGSRTLDPQHLPAVAAGYGVTPQELALALLWERLPCDRYLGPYLREVVGPAGTVEVTLATPDGQNWSATLALPVLPVRPRRPRRGRRARWRAALPGAPESNPKT